MTTQFKDRREAGQLLAAKLADYADRDDVIVLALPRGGLPVGYEVAKALNAPLDVFVVRKLGVPGHEELAMGAIASGDVRVLNQDVVESLGIFQRTIDDVASAEQKELERRESAYRGGHRRLEIEGRVVLLVDDGMATGSTMRAAAAAVRQKHPRKVVVAVPTAAASTVSDLDSEVDEVVTVITPEQFYGVGQWYEDFSQTSDEEVRDVLARAQSLHPEETDER